MKLPVGVSNRHCHLTKETYKQLFNKEELTKFKDLTQPGQYACEEMVTIKGPKGEIEKVRVLGPFREYNQVEVSKTDCYKLGINPPVRRSGNLDGAEEITVIGPSNEITIPSAIIANRHIHISKAFATKLNISDNDKVGVIISGDKQGIIEAEFKISDDGFFELHLDTDDANAFLLKQGDEVEIKLKK